MDRFQPLLVTACAAAIGGAIALPEVAFAQDAPAPADEVQALRAELTQARAQISDQDRRLTEQQRRLDLLEQRLAGLAQTTQAIHDEVAVSAPQPNAPVLRVGEPPRDSDRPPTVAVLDQQGSVVTRKGELVGELGVDYTRSDRNRAVFRGISAVEALLIGVFDINENRQDLVGASASLRYGLTNRLEIGARVPFLHRADTLITAPITNVSNSNPDQTIDSSTKGTGVGDVELSARYQLNHGGRNTPFLIANLQATMPTGRDPFSVKRNDTGSAIQSATGAGFWGITPSVTAILPTEPAVLFGTLGYTFNMARKVDTRLPQVQIDRVDPGDQINVSLGVGLALNERTSINLGYSHSWAFGTRTITRALDGTTGAVVGGPVATTTRDLQIGRLLVGVSQKFSEHLQVNWSVEVGATEDAPDVRTSLRIPIQF
jgi:hypothetical protein